MIRLRVVAPSLTQTKMIAGHPRFREFNGETVRFRNYYRCPRADGDLYRAIHITVQVADRFVEMQLLTDAREVVCELDHAIAFKHRLGPLSPSHWCWLKRISLAANIDDALGGLSSTGVAQDLNRQGIYRSMRAKILAFFPPEMRFSYPSG